MTVKKSLKYTFTQAEILELGSDLAREYAARTEAEANKKEVDAQLKAEIESHAAKAESLSRKLNNGYEYRDVECNEIFDYVQKTLSLERLDTGEIIYIRQLSVEELQSSLL